MRFILSLFFLTSVAFVNAQNTTALKFPDIEFKEGSNKGFTKKDDNFLNFYYGPSLAGIVVRGVYERLADKDAFDLRIKSPGSLGAVYEHLITDEIGIGADVNYNSIVVEYKLKIDDGNGNKIITDERITVTNYRLAFRANFHFSQSDKVDAYAFLSAGYRGRSFAYKSSIVRVGYSHSIPTLVPLGVKPGIGLRYFFSPNVGFCGEFSLGTPLICGGLTFKF